MESPCPTPAPTTRRRFLSLFPGVIGAASVASGIALVAEDDASATTVAWPKIVKASAIPVGGNYAFSFKKPSKFAVPGVQGVIHRASATSFKCWVLFCTHNGCSIMPNGPTALCPCHQSKFSLTTGLPLNPPAQFKLYSATVTTKSDGYIYYVKDN